MEFGPGLQGEELSSHVTPVCSQGGETGVAASQVHLVSGGWQANCWGRAQLEESERPELESQLSHLLAVGL